MGIFVFLDELEGSPLYFNKSLSFYPLVIANRAFIAISGFFHCFHLLDKGTSTKFFQFHNSLILKIKFISPTIPGEGQEYLPY